jgi:integrase/recombinase XerD
MNEIREAAEMYLQIRRSLGFKMKTEEKLLSKFISFLEQQGVTHITSPLAIRWATQCKPCHPAYWRHRLCTVRRFARYVQGLDPRTEIPPTGVLTHRYPRRTPHIYTESEILRLVKAAKRTRAPKELWGWTFSTIFGLLAVTGMRVAESVILDREDVDLQEGILTIRETKFRKSRLVPIHPTTTKALRRYSRFRDRLFPKVKTGSFFVTERGKRLRAKHVGKKFLTLARKIGLRGPEGTPGPHLHDLRHAFAVRTMLAWYRSGVDVEAHMPELSTYLGHLSTAETYWYVSAVPELLYLAAQRLEHT